MRYLMLCLVVLAACASSGRAPSPAAAAPGAVPIRLENSSRCELYIRVLEEGMTRGRYRVAPYDAKVVAYTPVLRSHALRFVAEPTNGCGAPYVLGALMVVPARIVVRIGAQPGESTVAEIDATPR